MHSGFFISKVYISVDTYQYTERGFKFSEDKMAVIL